MFYTMEACNQPNILIPGSIQSFVILKSSPFSAADSPRPNHFTAQSLPFQNAFKNPAKHAIVMLLYLLYCSPELNSLALA